MKITHVEPHRLSLPLPRPVKTARHDIRTLDTVLVEMQTDAGAVGLGYCFAFGPHRALALHALIKDLLPLYEGHDPTGVRAHFAHAWQAINFLGHAGAAVMALSALDTACCDLAAQGWDEPTAIRMGKALEAFDLFWLEEPLPYEDLEGCARVAAALTVPVATGETDYGSLGMRRHLEARAADILMPDLQRMGGVTEFLKAAALCEAFHTPVSPHLFPETSCHLFAAAPNGLILEHMTWCEALFEEPLRVSDGQVTLPQRPGIGLALSREAMRRFRV